MTRKQFQEFYQQALDTSLQYKKQSNLFSLIRFVLCVVIIADLLIGYFQNKPFLYILSLFCILLFMTIVYFHHKLQTKLRFITEKSHVYKEHILRMDNQWDLFEDGRCFMNDKDYRSLDLDIFGSHSLYQLINVCFTKKGQSLLALQLKKTQTCQEDVLRKQRAVLELSQLPDFVLQMQTYGKMISKQNQDIIDKFLQQKKNKEVIPTFLICIPIITCLSLILTFLSIGYPYSYIVAEIGVVIQLGYAFLTFYKHNQCFEPVCLLHKSLNGYYHVFDLIERQTFQSDYLKELQQSFKIPQHATYAIWQLSKISQGMTYRQNIFAFILLNGLFSFDCIEMYRYQKWQESYGIYIDTWMESLAWIEVCMSLAVLKIDDFDVNMPTFCDDMYLSFENLRHPFIPSNKVVGNSWTMRSQTNMITGSNMSGKTTFMRTIALNLILAYAGGFVFADKMGCSIMEIYTSMRVKDNVEEGISTFYGELLRIKDMIEESQKNQPMICFIDEIFKGTNSLDRFAGAKATIETLTLPHCLLFLTTHDFELCEIESVDIANYHFKEHYVDGKIHFDYHIQQGKCQSTNGVFLLKQLGIIKE